MRDLERSTIPKRTRYRKKFYKLVISATYKKKQTCI